MLFAIKQPSAIVPAFTSASFSDVCEYLPSDSVVMYSAPNVSERLSIQRGHFLLGPVRVGFRTSIPLSIEKPSELGNIAKAWVYRFMKARGRSGQLPPTEAVFRVTAKFKPALRTWLEKRSGLNAAFVLPTAWHRPHLDAFCSAHGRQTVWP